MMSTGAPMHAGTRLVVQKMVEDAERKFHERALFHHVVDDEYFARLTLIGTVNQKTITFYHRLNGRDRYPDAVQRQVHAVAEAIADEPLPSALACRACSNRFARDRLPRVEENRCGCTLRRSSRVIMCCPVLVSYSRALASSDVCYSPPMDPSGQQGILEHCIGAQRRPGHCARYGVTAVAQPSASFLPPSRLRTGSASSTLLTLRQRPSVV